MAPVLSLEDVHFCTRSLNRAHAGVQIFTLRGSFNYGQKNAGAFAG